MARHQLSLNERVWIVKNMYKLEYPIEVQRLWRKEMEDEPPVRSTINRLMNKFEETGSVLNIDPPGRPESVIDQITKDKVSSILKRDPHVSIRHMSSELNISTTSIYRVYKLLGFKPYIPKLIHELNEDDFDRRIEFCEIFLSLVENKPDLVNRIIWSDEATFNLNGHVNRHNSVYWATENPNITWEHSMKTERFTVWAGIWSKGVIGPYFFEDTVTAESYLSMLNEYFYPLYCDLPGKNSIFLMQDDASPHYALDVRD